VISLRQRLFSRQDVIVNQIEVSLVGMKATRARKLIKTPIIRKENL